MYYNNYYGYLPGYLENEEFEDRNVQSLCRKYMNYYVAGQLNDGTPVEGIIVDMDDDNVTMLVPEVVEDNDMRYGFYGYGGYDGYGGRRRYRRFRRRRIPYVQFVFPFVFPVPFYY